MSLMLSRKLTLEEAQRVPDGAGGYQETWTALGELWAEVKAGTGRERFGSGVTLSAVTYKITVRAAPMGAHERPKPDQRLRDGSRIFLIRAVAEYDTRGQYLTCFATEEVTG